MPADLLRRPGRGTGCRVAIGLLSFLLMQGSSLLLDAAVRPRPDPASFRSPQGLAIHILVMTVLFGLFLAASGSAPVAAALTVASLALFAVGSNAKHAMLGEPLLFSDLALFAALLRHPDFYLTALSLRQKGAAVAGIFALLPALAVLFVPHALPHLVGVGISAGAGSALALLLRSRICTALARIPEVHADFARHGLVATLLLYWLRWRAMSDPPVCMERLPATGLELVIVVQCESFADPVALFGDPALALPGLAQARASARAWGDLAVSGFGAYTMRTEYGVLFGRSEAALGFRRYDPFLTARGEASYALPARLGAAGYDCLFVHPHDLRFYARDRLMPAIGFDRLVGKEAFPPVTPGDGRYVDDRTLGAAVARLIDATTRPTFVYAVTMENHGPWMKDRLVGSPGGAHAYLHHLASSDAMLADLVAHLRRARRSALLVFFGDHRPSIPGVTAPDGARQTPYVMLRFAADGTLAPGEGRADLTPDALHHAILDAVTAAG